VKKVLYQSEGIENCEVIVIRKANGKGRIAILDAPNIFNRRGRATAGRLRQ
jgi:hypothetical protein